MTELTRYGCNHNHGPHEPLLQPMPDGYWTPWHLADQALRSPPPADAEKCSVCGGSGLALNGQGEPDECTHCKGNTVEPTPPEPDGRARQLCADVHINAMCGWAETLAEKAGWTRENANSFWMSYDAAREVAERVEACPEPLTIEQVLQHVQRLLFSKRIEFFKDLQRRTSSLVERGMVAWPDALLVLSRQDWNDAYSALTKGESHGS